MAMIFQLPGHQKKDREAERALEIPSSSLPSVGAFLLKMNLQRLTNFSHSLFLNVILILPLPHL